MNTANGRSNTIFVTAYDAYAIRAFEVHAIDYLLKPLSEARLNAALIETTGKIRDSETRAEAAQKRLAALQGNEAAIRVSLGNRRAIVGEVLASLQRMGRRPPPALLVRPEDMLSAIRTSMLLGAVLPEMRAETEALAADLAQLVTLRTAISGERDTLSRELTGMREERQRLSMLVEARQQALSAAQRDLEAQHDRSNELSRKAASLRDLIASVESDAVNQRAPDEAAKAETARKQADAVKNDGKTRVAGLPGVRCGHGAQEPSFHARGTADRAGQAVRLRVRGGGRARDRRRRAAGPGPVHLARPRDARVDERGALLHPAGRDRRGDARRRYRARRRVAPSRI